jgi:hypothetical protein
MTERSPPQPKRRNRQYTHHKESKENENLDFLHGVKLVRGLLGVALDASSESLGVGGGDSVGLLDELFALGMTDYFNLAWNCLMSMIFL